MIQANELRIGNFINGLYEPNYENEQEDHLEIALCKVVLLDSVGLTDNYIWVETKDTDNDNFDSFEPIPITELGLIYLGFEYYEPLKHYRIVIDDIWYSVNINYLGLKGFFFSFVNLNADETESMPVKEVKYVHKLQNLFFELSGIELKK